MNNKFLVAIILVLLAFVGILSARPISILPSDVQIIDKTIGAASGGDFYMPVNMHNNVTVGGGVLATSSIGAVTYTAANIQNNSLIVHTAASALTATFPASTTFSGFIPNAGDRTTIFVTPITTGITFAGGTGVILNSASTTKIVPAAGTGRFDFLRKANTDIEVLMTSGGW